MSVREQIERKINRAPKGTLFILTDFNSLADYNSIKTNIGNLVKDGKLEKVCTGIYMKPNYAAFLGVYLPPDSYDLVHTYARKFHWTISPSGNTAMNLLGLDTQVPAKMNFISTGPTRTVVLGELEVSFKHKALRDSDYSETTALVIEGLKTYRKKYGTDSITDEILNTINQRMTEKQFHKLEKEAAFTRAWIRDAIHRMTELRKKVNI